MVDQLFTEIDLKISARGLKDLNLIGKSDPICLVHQFDKKTKLWEQIGSTEVIKNDLNPDWKPIQVKYYFEKK